MKRFSTYREFKEYNISGKPTVVAIGNFDGCHLGHQSLLKHIKNVSESLDAHALVFTFAPHPRILFGAMKPQDLLFNADIKRNAFEFLEIDYHLDQIFDNDFRSLTPEKFMQEILLDSLNAKYVVIGDNFKFGLNRAGTSNWLQEELEARSVGCKVFSDIMSKSTNTISSTEIRKLLRKGEVIEANKLLGYQYTITGTVQRGNQIGSEIGFPTANVGGLYQLQPKTGVYVCKVALLSDQKNENLFSQNLKTYNAILNCGFRPSVTEDIVPTIEAHILDQHLGDLYGAEISVRFIDRLRDETKFESKEALVNQIKSDVITARNFFEKNKNPS